jgi:hypothetical protein
MTASLKSMNKHNKSLNNDNITIDAKHSEMINHFKSLNDSIPKLKEELKRLVSLYNNKDPVKKSDIEYILYRDQLRDNINEIKMKIQNINNNNDIHKYYLDVGVLLHNYYENIEISKNDDFKSTNFEDNLINFDNEVFDNDMDNDSVKSDEINNSNNTIGNNTILNFFNEYSVNNGESVNKNVNKSDVNTNDNKNDVNIKNESVYASTKISDFVKQEATFKKKNILDEYLQKIDSNYISRIKIVRDICNCPVCKIEMILYPSDGLQICEKCGLQQNILIESDKPSFKDPPLEVCYFTYKRLNHFNEFKHQNIYKRICIIYNLLINYVLFLIN